MTTPDTEGGDGPQHRSSVHIKLEHQGNLRMIQHGLRTIQTLRTSYRKGKSVHLLTEYRSVEMQRLDALGSLSETKF